MMNQQEPSFTLSGRNGVVSPALTAVDVQGRLDGVMLRLTLRQTYRNIVDHPLEVVYTFPLPHDAVLLALAAEFDGKRLVGRVLPVREAEAKYEDALSNGDVPVLLEVAENGLYTANLGNLSPGEQVTLEMQFAQLIAFERGARRIAIPTTIAPRYGSPAKAGLQVHQVPESSLAVGYPLSVSLTVSGAVEVADVACVTHAHSVEVVDDGVRLELATGAVMDRDVVVRVGRGGQVPGFLMTADDHISVFSPRVALAALAVPDRPVRAAISLRLLVDCSGSMAGDSISSARKALNAVLGGLKEGDQVSLSRFGNQVEHAVPPGMCREKHRAAIGAAIKATDATMGGTEMFGALQAIFAAWPCHQGTADVLLVTDGEVWDGDVLAEAARRSGHRVFAIGVGSAPAESVLRELAIGSGGAVEFATPGEALERAATRMLERIREAPGHDLRVSWGLAEPIWQMQSSQQAFSGDTIFALAGFAKATGPLKADWMNVDGDPFAPSPRVSGSTIELVPMVGDDLARIAAARRLSVLTAEEARKLAEDYQLVSAHTHLVLVNERDEGDRTTTAALLQRVPQMLAAGWGGTGSVKFCEMDMFEMPAKPSVWRHRQASPSPRFLASRIADDEFEIPAFLRKQTTVGTRPTLREWMHATAQFMEQSGNADDLERIQSGSTLAPELENAFDEIRAFGVDTPLIWQLLALWVASRSEPEGDRILAMILAVRVPHIDLERRGHIWAVFDRLLGHIKSDAWPVSRAERLERATESGLRRQNSSVSQVTGNGSSDRRTEMP